MRKLIAPIAALGMIGAAGAAHAAVTEATGTVTINASVESKCTASGGFTDTQTIGELADVDGKLSSSHTGATAGSPEFTSDFTVVCTGANAGVSVTSSALQVTPSATAPTGYTDTVNFTGRASFDLIDTSSTTSTLDVDDTSSSAGATADSFGSGKFLQNASDNVHISAYALTSSGDLLLAGDYQGKIEVTVTPAS